MTGREMPRGGGIDRRDFQKAGSPDGGEADSHSVRSQIRSFLSLDQPLFGKESSEPQI
jgi:hypothetical protein